MVSRYPWPQPYIKTTYNKMTKSNHARIQITMVLVIGFLVGSCIDKKLGLKIIENKEIKIEQYFISEITSSHEFLDLTSKRWNEVERIYEGNTESIDSVFIKNDTIFLTTKYDNPMIYDLAAIKFGYKIIVVKE